ncbi:PfkB family carbohydrate kinase [bacterium]
MSLLVVGSIAYDSIKTPFGEVNKVLGGAAIYSAVSASFFNSVNLVGVVGNDFPSEEIEFLQSRGIDTSGVTYQSGDTFFWQGEYGYDMNNAHTLDTRLNVFEDFDPKLPDCYIESDYVFLANIDPDIQINVLKQVKSPKFTALDTMDFWIKTKKDRLIDAISMVDILLINEGEAKQLTREYNLLKAAKSILKYGIKYLVIKRGEYGVLLFHDGNIFSLPAYPLEIVKDPTGAGDTFAGAFMGYISKFTKLDTQHLRKAVVMGTIMASINVEDFSLRRLRNIDLDYISVRLKEFRNVLHFEEIHF